MLRYEISTLHGVIISRDFDVYGQVKSQIYPGLH